MAQFVLGFMLGVVTALGVLWIAARLVVRWAARLAVQRKPVQSPVTFSTAGTASATWRSPAATHRNAPTSLS